MFLSLCCNQSLLTDPNPASPANPDAAHLYQTDIKTYNRLMIFLPYKYPFNICENSSKGNSMLTF